MTTTRGATMGSGEAKSISSMDGGVFSAKDDERLLLKTLQDREKPYVREVVAELGINENRAAYICQKWTDRGWYNYGVNVLAGWIEGDGLTATRDNWSVTVGAGISRQARR